MESQKNPQPDRRPPPLSPAHQAPPHRNAAPSQPDITAPTRSPKHEAEIEFPRQDFLSLGNLGLAASVLLGLAGFFAGWMSLPKLFARPGEDRITAAPADPAACALFVRANTRNDPQAMEQLGLIYIEGQRVARDEVIAARWFRKAADLWNTDAMYHLGLLTYFGQGVPRDETAAFELFQRAATRGHIAARVRMAACYASGSGTTQDLLHAQDSLNRAISAITRDQAAVDNATRQLMGEVQAILKAAAAATP